MGFIPLCLIKLYNKGVVMNKDGKIFETQWKESVDKDMYYFRIKDNPSSFSKDSSSVRFTLNNPYDCFIFYNRFLFPLELKSTELTSISIQRNKNQKNKMIKINQIEGLSESNKYDGVFSGFIFDFRSSGFTYWMGIEDFLLFLQENDKKSINEKDIIKYNGILIEKEKKRIYYKYNIKKMCIEIIER